MNGLGVVQGHGLFAGKWDSNFSRFRDFKDFRIWVEQKQKEGESEYNDIEIVTRDHADDDDETELPCSATEVEWFCRGAKLVDLKSGEGIAGLRRAALLDDRSSHGKNARERVRDYEEPLTATGLYNCLRVEVCSHPSLPLGPDAALIRL
jgi:hypothetical protein